MTLEINNKKTRFDGFNDTQNLNHLFKKIPSSITYLISSYLNINDARAMSNVCRSFRPIPLYYFRFAPNKMQEAFDYCCYDIRKKVGLDAFSQPWREGFEAALPLLTEFKLHAGSWEHKVYVQYYNEVSEDQILRILTMTSSLKKLFVEFCTNKILQFTSTMKLTELNITISEDLDYSFLNPTLTKLTIQTDAQKILSIKNFDPKMQALHNLESLTLKSSNDDTKLSREFQIFITTLFNLKKLEIRRPCICIQPENFVYLKTLKEFTLYYNQIQTHFMSEKGIPYSLEILTIHGLMLNVLKLKDLRDKIISSENLRVVNLIYTDYCGNSLINDLCNSEIASLDKVKIRFNNVDFQYFHNYKIKHLSIGYFISAADLKNKFYINVNLEELELICGYYSVNFDEYFILALQLLSEKITSIKDNDNDDFVWKKSFLEQLKRTPLTKCTHLKGYFLYEDKSPIPTSELLSLFPALIPENINRIWKDRYINYTSFPKVFRCF